MCVCVCVCVCENVCMNTCMYRCVSVILAFTHKAVHNFLINQFINTSKVRSLYNNDTTNPDHGSTTLLILADCPRPGLYYMAARASVMAAAH